MYGMVRHHDTAWSKQFVLSEIIPFIRKAVEDYHYQLATINFENGSVSNPNQSVSKIVPLLKSDAMINGMEKSFIEQGLPDEDRYKLISWHLVGRVRVIAAFDAPNNFQFMHRYNVEELGITPDQTKDHAIENFRTMAMRIKMRNDYTKPIVTIDRIGGIASSLLLLPDFWEKEATKARDELVIYVADYDTLLVARKSDKQGVQKIIGLALSRAIASVFSPPIFFVFDRNGLRLLEHSDMT
jgi:uncharacterized protein YtpQ (UPF0354 family)